jgi:hypothetical protein
MRMASTMRPPVALLIGSAVAAAASALTLQADAIEAAYNNRLASSLAFLIASVLLQLLGLKLPGRGTLSVSAVGLVGAAIALGTGPAMAIGIVTALAQWGRSRGLAHRALFDAANLALSAGAAGVAFERIASLENSGFVHLLAALVAGLAYVVVNLGLLCLAMALSEARSPLTIWQERFHSARFHVLAFGVLGLLAATADDRLGAAALVAFVLPPVLLALSIRDGLTRFRPAL